MNCEYRVVGYYSIRVRLYKIILLYVYGVYGRMTCHSNTKSVLQKTEEKIERSVQGFWCNAKFDKCGN